jgi:hypothetical protein
MDAPDLAQIAALEMRANGFEPVFAPDSCAKLNAGRRTVRRAQATSVICAAASGSRSTTSIRSTWTS